MRFADELEIDLKPISTSKSNDILAEVGLDDEPLSDTVPDVFNELDPNIRSEDRQTMISITGYRYKDGKLQLRLLMNSEETQWMDFRDVKEDYPPRCATYIVDNFKSRSGRKDGDRVLSWAKKTLCDCERAVKGMVRLCNFVLDDDDDIRRVRRAVRAKNKNKRKAPPKRLKYGVQEPKDDGNNLWAEAINKEMSALYEMDCFSYHEKGYKPNKHEGYQWTRVHMIFDVKKDLRRKARLVAGAHLLELFDTEVYSSMMKGISVKPIHVIAHQFQSALW